MNTINNNNNIEINNNNTTDNSNNNNNNTNNNNNCSNTPTNYYHHNIQQYNYIRELLSSEQTEILSPLNGQQVECKCTSLYSSNCTCFGELLFPIIVKEFSEDHFEHVCNINSKYTLCSIHNQNNSTTCQHQSNPMVYENDKSSVSLLSSNNINNSNNNITSKTNLTTSSSTTNNNDEYCNNNAILYICVKCVKLLCLECVDCHEHSFEDIYRVNVHSPNFQILYSCLLNHNVPINCLFDAIKKEYEDCIHLVHFFYKDPKLIDELAYIFNEFVELTRRVISIEKELVLSTFLKSFNKNNNQNNSSFVNNNNSGINISIDKRNNKKKN